MKSSTAHRLSGLKAKSFEGAAGQTAGYSNFVGIMRYILPIGALVLLGVVLLLMLTHRRVTQGAEGASTARKEASDQGAPCECGALVGEHISEPDLDAD